jgi:hypothetical protein
MRNPHRPTTKNLFAAKIATKPNARDIKRDCFNVVHCRKNGAASFSTSAEHRTCDGEFKWLMRQSAFLGAIAYTRRSVTRMPIAFPSAALFARRRIALMA